MSTFEIEYDFKGTGKARVIARNEQMARERFYDGIKTTYLGEHQSNFEINSLKFIKN